MDVKRWTQLDNVRAYYEFLKNMNGSFNRNFCKNPGSALEEKVFSDQSIAGKFYAL